MNMSKKFLINCFVVVCLFLTVYTEAALATPTASEMDFIVKDIEIQGHKRVTFGGILRALPIQVGDRVNEKRIADAIRSLYQTGDFDDIQIYKDGQTLIVKVNERKTISEITFIGNKDFKKELLTQELKIHGVAVAEPFNPAVIHDLKMQLENSYHSLGKYSASVEIKQKPSAQGTIALEFIFVEGQAAKIEQINILGNHVFTEAELLRVIQSSDFPLSIPLWSKNKYQQQALLGDLESLRSFYMDQGYLEFQIKSTQVALKPDKTGVYITIEINEGHPVVIDEIHLQGNFVGHKQAIEDLIIYQTGEYFSGKKVADTEKKIAEFLGRFGYGYPKITTIPEIQSETQKAKLTIQVDPGNRMYVRHVLFSGNAATKDEVLRREMRQLESTWLSSQNIELSKRRLQQLGYFNKVDIDIQRVPDTNDTVDVYVKVEEAKSGNISLGVNYSLQDGPGISLGLQQDNFLGTGDYVGINLQGNRNTQEIDLNHINPYYTPDGVSFGKRVFFTRFEAQKNNIIDYTDRSFGFQLNTSIPLSEINELQFTGGFKRSELLQEQSYEQIRSFWERVGSDVVQGAIARFNLFEFSSTWSRNTLNKGIFPTTGSRQELSGKLSLPISDLKFWKASFDNRYYHALDKHEQWVFHNRTFLAYGNGYGGSGSESRQLPFFENYFAGGSKFLRGFETNSVGPKALLSYDDAGATQLIATNTSLGGNAIAVNSSHLFFPFYPLPEKWRNQVRFSVFLDAGNVWDTYYDYNALARQCTQNCEYLEDASKPRHIRVSTGVSFQFLTPFGPVSMSFAKALKQYPGDQTKLFDFNISKTF